MDIHSSLSVIVTLYQSTYSYSSDMVARQFRASLIWSAVKYEFPLAVGKLPKLQQYKDSIGKIPLQMMFIRYELNTLSRPFSHKKNVSSCSMSCPAWPETSPANRFKFSISETLALISTLDAMTDVCDNAVVPLEE